MRLALVVICNFMNTEHKYFLFEEVYAHCNFALAGLTEVKYHLEDEFNFQHKGLWTDLHMGLANAAIVSAYLFSTKNSAKRRTELLKQILQPSENSPLMDKSARNYLTHIDEKFDYWLNNSTNFSGMLEAVFPNRESFKYIDSGRQFIRRVFLKEELIFIFQSGQEKKEFELKPLIAELELILKNAERYLDDIENADNGLYIIRPK